MENLNFSKIIELKKRIDANLLKLHLTMNDLKKIFTKLNTSINNDTSYLGIDSFNFQIKLIEIKITNSEKIYLLITNRLYKDYYKLYKNIRKYLESTYQFPLKENNYPVYKELETDKKYDFDNIVKIKEEMDEFIKYLTTNISLRKKNLLEFKESEEKGLMCNNYIIEEEVYIKCLEEKLNLYKQHLQTYNKYHYLYLQSCLTEIKNLSNMISSEIKVKNNESLKVKEEIKIPNKSEENKESEPKENIIIYSSNVDVEFTNEESSDSNQDEFKDIELGSLKLPDEEVEEVLSDNI